MSEKRKKLDANSLQTRINLLFLLLVVGLEGLMAVYWLVVLEPRVMERVRVSAERLAQAQAHVLLDALTSESGDARQARIIKAMDKILVFKDPDSDEFLTVGVEMRVDCNTFKACDKSGELTLNRGDSGCEECFITEVPLYSEITRESLGVVRLHNSNEFQRHFKKGVQSIFFAGAGVGLALLLLSWFGVNAMIARIKRTEKTLQEKQAQVVHAGRLAAMGEMAAGIAHEINQPLSIIRVASDGLKAYFKKRDPGTMEEEAVEAIIGQVERAGGIITNMRAFARVRPDDAAPADLIEPLNTALSFFKEQFRIHQISLEVDLPDRLPRVSVNPQKFEQIVVNLLSNARFAVDEKRKTAGPEYKKVVAARLGPGDENDLAVFEVEDNGVGMAPGVLDRCLEPFYTTKEVGEGSGIGLSIVNSIVREYKMKLEIRSAPGRGSSFRVRFKR
ncbi:MAG: hypothetical protein GY859_09515 [Desulfobacterales bacterium]|nr:hypothetical protein [Desulfobacterales bacterium]